MSGRVLHYLLQHKYQHPSSPAEMGYPQHQLQPLLLEQLYPGVRLLAGLPHVLHQARPLLSPEVELVFDQQGLSSEVFLLARQQSVSLHSRLQVVNSCQQQVIGRRNKSKFSHVYTLQEDELPTDLLQLQPLVQVHSVKFQIRVIILPQQEEEIQKKGPAVLVSAFPYSLGRLGDWQVAVRRQAQHYELQLYRAKCQLIQRLVYRDYQTRYYQRRRLVLLVLGQVAESLVERAVLSKPFSEVLFFYSIQDYRESLPRLSLNREATVICEQGLVQQLIGLEGWDKLRIIRVRERMNEKALGREIIVKREQMRVYLNNGFSQLGEIICQKQDGAPPSEVDQVFLFLCDQIFAAKQFDNAESTVKDQEEKEVNRGQKQGQGQTAPTCKKAVQAQFTHEQYTQVQTVQKCSPKARLEQKPPDSAIIQLNGEGEGQVKYEMFQTLQNLIKLNKQQADRIYSKAGLKQARRIKALSRRTIDLQGSERYALPEQPSFSANAESVNSNQKSGFQKREVSLTKRFSIDKESKKKKLKALSLRRQSQLIELQKERQSERQLIESERVKIQSITPKRRPVRLQGKKEHFVPVYLSSIQERQPQTRPYKSASKRALRRLDQLLKQFEAAAFKERIAVFYQIIFLNSLQLLNPSQQAAVLEDELSGIQAGVSWYQVISRLIAEREALLRQYRASAAKEEQELLLNMLREATFRTIDAVGDWRREIRGRNRLLSECVFMWEGQNYLAKVGREGVDYCREEGADQSRQVKLRLYGRRLALEQSLGPGP